MKNLYLFGTIILTIFLLLPIKAGAQWNHTGPEGGEVRAFCESSGAIFAAPWSGGIYRSTDNGLTWTAVNNGLTEINIRITALFSDGSNVFAGSWGSGVFRSTDMGNSWVDVNGVATSGTAVHAFVQNGSSLFMGSQGGGVCLTTDNGASWVAVNNGMLSLDVRDLTVMGTTIYAATWGATSRVLKSTDNGANWVQASNGITFPLDDPCLGTAGNTIFLGTYAHGVYLSTDDGANWTEANNGLPAGATIREFAVDGTNIFAATRQSGVFLSTDNGSNWTPVNSGLTTSGVEALMFSSSQDLYAGTSTKGIFRSTNDGAAWTESNTGFDATTVYAYVSIPDGVGGKTMYAGTGSGVYSSTDNGLNWNYEGINAWVTGLVVMGTDIFASTMGSGVFRSTDGGATWFQSGLAGSMLQTLYGHGTDLYAGAAFFGGAARSTDNGSSWTLIPGLDYKWVMSFTANENYIFAGAIFGGAFRSDDNGATFAAINNGLDSRVSTLAVMDTSTIFAGTGDPNGQAAAGIYKSIDNGNNWTQVNNGLPANLMVWSLAVTGSNVFATSSSSDGRIADVYLTSDSGSSWQPVTTGLTSNYIQKLYIEDTDIFAGTIGSGTWWRPLSEMIPMLPIAPANLIAVADTFSVALSWTDNSNNELGFRIERKDDSLSVPGTWTFVGSVGADETAFTDTGLTPFTVYSYKVYAYNAVGNSESDSIQTVTIIPVELTSFTASVTGNRVNLNWKTVTETNNRGFEIERVSHPELVSGSSAPQWADVAFVSGSGTTTEPRSYSFTDDNLAAGRYSYRLKQVDFNGICNYSNALEVSIDIPLQYSLKQNYPNPFNPSTNLSFSLKTDAMVSLSIYNVLGEKIASLINHNEMSAGEHTIRFDASDMPTGIYVYTLEARGTDGSNFKSSNKMMLIK